jgi:hypothetical protein
VERGQGSAKGGEILSSGNIAVPPPEEYARITAGFKSWSSFLINYTIVTVLVTASCRSGLLSLPAIRRTSDLSESLLTSLCQREEFPLFGKEGPREILQERVHTISTILAIKSQGDGCVSGG